MRTKLCCQQEANSSVMFSSGVDPQLETRLDVGEGPIQLLAEACEEEQSFTEPETISSDIEYDHAVNQMKTDEQTVLKWRLLTKAIWTKSTIGYSNKS